MSGFMAGVLVGGFLGGIVGVLVVCCLVVAARADRASELAAPTSELTPEGRALFAKIVGYDKPLDRRVRH